MGDWILYADQKPADRGVYEWRVPSVALPGLVVTFLAHMRKRGAGYERVISPLFDYWDGYRVHVPNGAQWRETSQGADLPWHSYGDVQPEGVALLPCPFCKRVPSWDGRCRSANGGLYVTGEPHRYNDWNLKCCSFAGQPRGKDPRSLAEQRNTLIRDFVNAEIERLRAREKALTAALEDASGTLDDVIESLVGNIGGPVEEAIIDKLRNLDDRLRAAARQEPSHD